ncbi:MAG: EAL domain-containing protein [Gammaproteobacteria bacterium]|nr:EAL domain-containing protein [Gammaproteobacteria bacterium]
MLTFNRYLISIAAITAVILFSSFYFLHYEQQQIKSNLIIQHYKNVAIETGYQLKTQLHRLSDIPQLQSLINRTTAKETTIKAISIAQGSHILISSDPAINQVPAKVDSLSILSSTSTIDIESILKKYHLTYPVALYDQSTPVNLTIIITMDKKTVSRLLSGHLNHFLIYLGLPTTMLLIMLFLIFRKTVTTPLETLRQYAYYQSSTPKKMFLIELESIRASMVQSFSRLEAEKHALYISSREDHLSGLPNRNQLNERLNWLIEESHRNKKSFAFLFLDLDNFKRVNDTLGHDVGDELLIKMSSIMQKIIREYDIIARIGGDEFAIILSEYKNHIELNHIINRILDEISNPLLIQNNPITVSVSIGVAFYPKDGTDSKTLMKNADIAMYDAKHAGKNQIKYFTEDLNQQIIQSISIENDLRVAIKASQFELYYQPKTDTVTGEIIGAEALIRWNHPTKGLVPPDVFIPIAEQSGLIVPIGHWIMATAMQQQVKFVEEGLTLSVSINLSSVQFSHQNFIQDFTEALESSGALPKDIDVEVTESVLMEYSQANLELLTKIREFGCTISLDDFGTGYSSLAYLKNFPIDTLKIDKSFMDEYADHSGKIFIETIINMAHTLHIKVIAEGVETEHQLSYLQSVNCEHYQGYYCSKPVPAKDFIKVVKANNG